LEGLNYWNRGECKGRDGHKFAHNLTSGYSVDNPMQETKGSGTVEVCDHELIDGCENIFIPLLNAIKQALKK